MASEWAEGQTLSPHFTLVHKIADAGDHESWLAINNVTNERIFLKILNPHLNAVEWERITANIENLRGLVHEHITRVSEYWTSEDGHFLAEQYINGGKHFTPTKTASVWPFLQQTINALQYAHNVGIAHGNLHPGNLVVDSTGNIHITGFGLPANNDEYRSYLSPEVRNGHTPDLTDDIYSLGCLIFECIAGKQWQAQIELDTPLPPEIDAVLKIMLSESSYERQVELRSVLDTLAAHFEQTDSQITPLRFDRNSPVPAAPEKIYSTPPVVTREQHHIATSTVVTGLAAIAIIAALMFLFLPRSLDERSELVAVSPAPTHVPSAKAEPVKPVIAPLEQARLEYMQEEGQKLAKIILRKQIGLEDRGVMLWAFADYEDITVKLEQAEDMFRAGEFDAALRGYENLIAALDELSEKINPVLDEQLSLGDQALLDGDATLALTAFTIASAIDRTSAAINAKLTRAENLEQVRSLMKQGEMQEGAGLPNEALTFYRQAQKLDRLWQEAGIAVNRMRSQIKQQRFSDAMSAAFNALIDKQYATAVQGFATAQEILPDSREPADGLLQVDQAERSDAIANHQRRAAELQARDDWAGAIGEFQTALGIDPSLVFAGDGVAYATMRLELDNKLQRYLSDPSLLQEDEALKDAKKTLASVSRVAPKSETILAYMDTLALLISGARIKIPVTITSNNRTDVTVLRISRLGMIDTTVLGLIPGRYTITGKRNGYRDVRHDLTVLSGEMVPPILVACTERI